MLHIVSLGFLYRDCPVIVLFLGSVAILAVGKLTKQSVLALAVPAKGRAFLWDETLKGFGIMVTHKNMRSYVVQYRIGGREAATRRITIGQHGNPWTQEKARERARELLEMVRRKIDPVQADRDRLALERAGRADDQRFKFSAVAEEYLASKVEQGLRTACEVSRIFDRDIIPHFGNMPLPKIEDTDIDSFLNTFGIARRSSANAAHNWLRAMFNWAVKKRRFGIAVSPMLHIEEPYSRAKRNRVLTDAELKLVLQCAAELGGPATNLVQLLAYTGQRRREVSGMRWEEINVETREWRIPGLRTKNKREHLCPLSKGALEILNSIQPDPALRRGYVLSNSGERPISGYSKTKKRLDELITVQLIARAAETGAEPVPMPRWVYHDLRRTLATGFQRLGVRIEHTEAVLNHISGTRGGIVSVYQLYEYWPEKVAAMDLWDQRLEEICRGTSDRA